MAKELSRRQARTILARFRSDLESAGDVSHLNITAMMDMMSILLVFLLKQFSVEQTSLNLADSLQLPKSSAVLKPALSVNVTVTTNAVVVEGEPVVSVRNGAVDERSKRDGANGYYITPLVDLLTKHANKHKKIEALTGGRQKFDHSMLLLVDRSIPYRLVTEVLYSAGQAEFTNYRLVVLSKSQ
jgi:biopolymer transport protein ExbD